MVDGQQRFTTLKILREILDKEADLTLKFAIRESVWEQFNSDEKTSDADINRMQKAKLFLESAIEAFVDDKKEFRIFLLEQVKLVVTKVPNNADLNKLFELINGRGEQLKQHEVLKAKILSKIKDVSKRYKYGKIWDICADMDTLLEISIKASLGISWKTYWEEFKEIQLDTIAQKFDVNDEKSDTSHLTIDELIKPIDGNHKKGDNSDVSTNIPDDDDEGDTRYLAIISFELFLLYSLVAFDSVQYFAKMKELKIEFKDKNLIKIFTNTLLDKENHYEQFIEFMFKFRKSFDRFIIRNKHEVAQVSNDTNHRIVEVKPSSSGNTKSRTINDKDNTRDLSLLQSMLYHAHTRNTQEWIIPFLMNIENDSSTNNTLNLLKKIDNILYSQFNQQETVLKRAATIKKHGCADSSIHYTHILDYLNKVPDDYHYFSHYWFYKMDWIVWSLMSKSDKANNNKFKFTARNSIEHISPQNPQDENIDTDKVASDWLNSFGNLILVSVSHNSGFSNNGFKAKMGYFEDKKIKNLKMSLIDRNEPWGTQCKRHLADCIKLVEEYFNSFS